MADDTRDSLPRSERLASVQQPGLAVLLKGLAHSLQPLLLLTEVYIHQVLLVPELPHPQPVRQSNTKAQTTPSSAPAFSIPGSPFPMRAEH